MPGKLPPYMVPKTIEEVKANFLHLEQDEDIAESLTTLTRIKVKRDALTISQAYNFIIDWRVKDILNKIGE